MYEVNGEFKVVKPNRLPNPEPWMHAQITGKKRTKDTHGFASVTEFKAVIYVWDTREIIACVGFHVGDAAPDLFSKCTKAKDNHRPLVLKETK